MARPRSIKTIIKTGIINRLEKEKAELNERCKAIIEDKYKERLGYTNTIAEQSEQIIKLEDAVKNLHEVIINFTVEKYGAK